MTIVRTRTPSGEAIVILPEAEFERLRELAEDMLDTRTLDASERRLAADEDDLAALRRAPSPLAFWRGRRGVAADVLAQLCAVEPSLLAAIERGGVTAEPALYQRLARALDVDVEDLAPEAAGA
ncbi:XRE family transcriptional regulator [Methylorubrum sp. Q1]|uniref:helix-turn-helix domain-containing protein n=1 Tax=Methylorubrum sp. Q1 TaxID=2562453 RepID=UPI00107642F6|nr:helix-turn-helix transcriptional regulator [Methylorubrum sp. Q1]TFZ57929.1 XRE family transcriptional regulator [Methylorubrum sp. Q1]